jgi:hypothetical protein
LLCLSPLAAGWGMGAAYCKFYPSTRYCCTKMCDKASRDGLRDKQMDRINRLRNQSQKANAAAASAAASADVDSEN